jgi:hypothetical protein
MNNKNLTLARQKVEEMASLKEQLVELENDVNEILDMELPDENLSVDTTDAPEDLDKLALKLVKFAWSTKQKGDDLV